MQQSWTTKKLNASVSLVEYESRELVAFVTSDWHWDSIKCDRDLLRSDLMIAKKINAPVFVFGDLFDAMGGKYDPRGSKDELRPELLAGNYFDEAIEQCADWLTPFAGSIAMISPGNHETAIRKRQETCMTTRLVERLKAAGSPVQQGGYAGWVMFRARRGNKGSNTYRLWYHHGYGGGGPITRGTIDFSRYMIDVDADAIVSGHVHQKTLIEAQRQRITQTGTPTTSPVYLIRSASYKNESLTDGWAVEKGMSARPLGGWWVRLRWAERNSHIAASFHHHPPGV